MGDASKAVARWTPTHEMAGSALGYYVNHDDYQRIQATVDELRAEVERYKVPWQEFSDKTEWVQATAQPRELGKHRADVLRERIERAEAALADMRARLEAAPVVVVPQLQVHTGLPKSRWQPHAICLPRELAGQRVRLVAEGEA